ncbi:RHS repeat-associated core domain-containing protein [Enterobacter ludwigii]|uniref:RHS repeat-associated core domain-containing protein n=1 Tax=Enterobacter ludwigii TaxID=299767 RepID=UPI003F6F5ACC
MKDTTEMDTTGNQSSLLGFNGERLDPVLGGYHLGNGYRLYNPTLRRFTAPDDMSPFGAGGINPYAYCAGDPINHTDPTGHMKRAHSPDGSPLREVRRVLARGVEDVATEGEAEEVRDVRRVEQRMADIPGTSADTETDGEGEIHKILLRASDRGTLHVDGEPAEHIGALEASRVPRVEHEYDEVKRLYKTHIPVFWQDGDEPTQEVLAQAVNQGEGVSRGTNVDTASRYARQEGWFCVHKWKGEWRDVIVQPVQVNERNFISVPAPESYLNAGYKTSWSNVMNKAGYSSVQLRGPTIPVESRMPSYYRDVVDPGVCDYLLYMRPFTGL